jgi:multiple sugar transport system ATP-binding protein
MNKGKIEQIGTPHDLYHTPLTRFVAGFIGSPAMNFIPCRLEAAGDDLRVRLTDTIALPVPPDRVGRYRPHLDNDNLTFGIRPEHLTEKKHVEDGGPLAYFDATLEVIEPLGMETLVLFTLKGVEICGRVSPKAGAAVGMRMPMAVHLENAHLIDEATGHVL